MKFQLCFAIMFLFVLCSCSDDSELLKNEIPLPYDIYIHGTLKSQEAVYWKNGQKVELTDGTKTSFSTGAVFSGSDYYVVGVGPQPTSGYAVTYWKNGVPIQGPEGLSDSRSGMIAVEGTDVFVTGNQGLFAMLWKNGIGTQLSDGENYSMTSHIAISGTNVHLLGFEGNQEFTRAIYWKNGIEVDFIENPLNYSFFSDMVLEGNNVHIIGYMYENEGDIPVRKYWVNGLEAEIPEGIKPVSLEVVGSDVYMLDSGGFKYSKNGVVHEIKISEPLPGTLYGKDFTVRDNDVFVLVEQLLENNYMGARLFRNGVELKIFAGTPDEVFMGLTIVNK